MNRYPTNISIVNTMTGKKEPLSTIYENEIRMYACGITVYDYCHIGHAMQAIFFDAIRNFMEFAGYKVTYVRNHTDVDDKIIKRALERNMAPTALSALMIDETNKDLQSLKVNLATYEPKVSQCVPEIIEMVQTLVEKGFAYKTTDGDVYFRVRQKENYGKLSHRKIDDLLETVRDIVVGDKEDPLDFALWKADKTEGASWSSPWGQGRPGWHIECSVMSKKYLGDSFDIHGGGRDLVFPHHENEIAQSEAANSCSYANYWIHSGLLTIQKQKMSKSLGNQINIRDFLKEYPAEVIRLAYLTRHYSSHIDFSEQVFLESMDRLNYYYNSLHKAQQQIASFKGTMGQSLFDKTEFIQKIVEIMNDDFNTPQAIGEINLAFRKMNEVLMQKNSPEKIATLNSILEAITEIDRIFLIFSENPEQMISRMKSSFLQKNHLTESWVLGKLEERKQAKLSKDFAKADAIRLELTQASIDVFDTPQGTQWGVKFNQT